MGSHAKAIQCRNLTLDVSLRNPPELKEVLIADFFQIATKKP